MSTFFIPDEDGLPKLYAGTYPAHIVKLEVREWNGSKVFDVNYRISEEAGNMTVVDPETKETVVPTNMIGKLFKHGRNMSIWYTPDPIPEERWRNRNYFEFFENTLGVKFERKEVSGKQAVILHEVDEDEIFGIPVWVTIAPEQDKKDPEKSYFKVIAVKKREGDKMSREEYDKIMNQNLEDSLPF